MAHSTYDVRSRLKTQSTDRAGNTPGTRRVRGFSIFLVPLIAISTLSSLSAQPLPDQLKKVTGPSSSPVNLISADALAAVGWSGSESLGDSFRGTGLGEILNEPRMQELFGALWPSIEALVREELDNAEEREELLLAREAISLLWSQPVAVSFLGLDIVDGEPIPKVVACLKGEKGAKRVYEALENIRVREGAPADSYPGAASAQRVALPGAPVSFVYGVERGCFFLAIGDQAAQSALATIRGAEASLVTTTAFVDAWQKAVSASMPVAWAYADGARLLEHVKHHLANADAALPAPVEALLGVEALGRLGPILMSVGIQGEGFRRSCSIGWRTEGDPGAPLDDDSLLFVPKDTSFFSYEDCDVAGLFRTAKSFIEGLDPEAGRQIRSMQAFADGFLGFRLEEDLIANLGRRFMIFEEPTTSGILPGLCWVLRPNDGESIEMCVRRVTTSLGAIAGMQGIGVSVGERSGISFIETSGAPNPIAPAWAIRGERLLLALHPAVLEEVLHRVDAPDARERSILANADFQAGRKRISGGQHGLFYTDTPAAVADLYPTLLPLFQAGVAGLGGQVTGLSAGQLPPPYMVNERMFGDIHGYRRTNDGWLWEAHGPPPFTLPDLGSFTALLAAGAVLPALAAAQAVDSVHEARVLATVVHHEAYAQIILNGCFQWIAQHGKYPTRLEELVEAGILDQSFLEPEGEPMWVYAGPLSVDVDGVVLFHSVHPVEGGEYIYATTDHEVGTASKRELEAMVERSNWPKRKESF